MAREKIPVNLYLFRAAQGAAPWCVPGRSKQSPICQVSCLGKRPFSDEGVLEAGSHEEFRERLKPKSSPACLPASCDVYLRMLSVQCTSLWY